MHLTRPFFRITLYLLTPVLLLIFTLSAHVIASANLPESIIVIDTFTDSVLKDNLPEGWKPLVFSRKKRHTKYSIEKEQCGGCLRAESHQSASAIYKEMRVDLRQYPILSWSWRVEGTLKDGNAHFKKGDDYPARLYAAFEFEPEKATALEKLKHKLLRSIYGVDPPGKTITYIWANKLPRGTAIPNAFSENMMMVAVQSGDEKAGRWVQEERNIYEDYKELFNEEPPPLCGLIVMTDSDNTGSSAVGWYDDIILKKG